MRRGNWRQFASEREAIEREKEKEAKANYRRGSGNRQRDKEV